MKNSRRNWVACCALAVVLLPTDARAAELLPPGTLIVKPGPDGEPVAPAVEQIDLPWTVNEKASYNITREEAEQVFVISRDLEACTRGFAECQADREKPPAPRSRWGWIAGAVAVAFAAGVFAGVEAD